MANSTSQKCLNIGLTELGVVKTKKTHARSAPKMVKSIHQWPNIKCFGHCDRWDWIKTFGVQQNDSSTSSSISPMGDHSDPPKREEKSRRTQEKVRTWETVRRKVCSWKCNNESERRQYQADKGQMLGHRHDSCLWDKRQKKMMPGKDSTVAVDELATLNKMCWIKLHLSKALEKKNLRCKVRTLLARRRYYWTL